MRKTDVEETCDDGGGLTASQSQSADEGQHEKADILGNGKCVVVGYS